MLALSPCQERAPLSTTVWHRPVLAACALAVAPGHAAGSSPIRGEVSVWAGASSSGGAGLRAVEASAWLADDWRVWAVYDDSLNIDDPSLRRQGDETEGYFAGVMHQFHANWQGVVEAGYRHQPGGRHQNIYTAEILHLDDGDVTRLGLQINPHSAGFTEEFVIASHRMRVAPGWSVEPTAIYGRLGRFEDEEWRGILRVEYRGEGWGALAGIGGGAIDSVFRDDSGGVFVADARLSVKVLGDHEVHVALRHEELPRFENTLVMVGVTVRFAAD
jgi:hypothetical protein